MTRQGFDFFGQAVNAFVQPAPIAGQFLNNPLHARRQDVGAGGEDDRQLGAQETQPLVHRNPALQQEGVDLINNADALADQPLQHPMQRLQIELVGRLGSDEFHRWALNASAIASASRKSFF